MQPAASQSGAPRSGVQANLSEHFDAAAYRQIKLSLEKGFWMAVRA